jgi:outer membrane protein assembly factor BamB
MRSVLAGAFVLSMAALPAPAADWPQFMRTSEHTGDAADEALALPLGLVAQVKLDDAVMTSPAVVGGLAYVVDQMGTAYCVDPRAGRIVWKAAPDGDKAMGSNTSSPCVAKGRMYYGTTAGTLHILDCKDGKVVKTVAVGSPIISAPTFANDALYFQPLDAVLRCLDPDGNEKWKWDHYKQYQEPPETTKAEAGKRGHPGSYERPHYGGGDVAVSGTKVVTSFGWDLVCLEDQGKAAALAWCRRCPSGRDGAAPMSSSISGEWVYTSGAGADGHLAMIRLALKDGTNAPQGVPGIPVQWTVPAVRGSLVATRNCGWLKDEIQVYEVGKSRATLWQDPKASTPAICSPALAKDHLVAPTLKGQVLVLDLVPKPKGQPFVFRTASGKGIGSSPAVSGGMVLFGCDDGCLYVLGPGGALQPRKEEKPLVSEPRSKLVPATGKAYGWTGTAGDQQGTHFADDPNLKPPLRVRWATRAFGHFKTPAVATEDGDLITVTLARTVTCQEQATGRLRWRMRFPGDAEELGSSAGLLATGGRVYVPVPNNRAPDVPGLRTGLLICLDQKSGELLWSAEIGSKFVWTRGSPVVADGKVAFIHNRKGAQKGPVVQAWDAATGAPAWTVELKAASADNAFGVTDGKTFYFSAADQYDGCVKTKGPPGETVAVEAASGKVLWRSGEFVSGLTIALRGERLYLVGYDSCVNCVSAKDGAAIWKSPPYGCRYISLGTDYIVPRGYGGGAGRAGLADGKPVPFKDRGAQLGGDAHACGPVALTPNLSVNVTVNGLHVRDLKTGALLWLSPGFAPRGCVNPSLANGRVFWPSAASGLIYCWEPEK